MSADSTIHSTSAVSPDAVLGRGVTIGAFALVHANVTIGDGCFVDSHCVLGSPTAGYYDDPGTYEHAACSIGAGAVIRSHGVIYAGVTTGADFSTGHHVTIREGTTIGNGVRIGTASDVQADVLVGDYARMHSRVFVARGSVLEDFSWLFPHALLIDDPHPPSDTCTQGPRIRRFAVVGARSTIFPGVEVGEGAVVGAASLVREDVPPHTVVIGSPARVYGPTSAVVCRDGRIDQVYPWWLHFRRGYPDGVLPSTDSEPVV